MMKKRRTKAVFLCTAITVVLLAGGCQKNDTSSGNTNIYYTAIEGGEYYEGWAAQLQEQAEAKNAGFDYGFANNSVETQVSQIKEGLANGSNVFLCGLVSADTATEIKAIAEDTPIVFINYAPSDSDLEKDKYIYVASDEYMAGQYQAEYILEQFADKDEINVMLLKGPKDASGTIGRTNGLKQTLKASGKKINYVFEDYANWLPDTAKELVSIFLRTGKTVDCVAANNDDMAVGAVSAYEDAGINTDSILFLGVDASATGCEAIANGRMDFTVYQPMSSQMSSAIDAALALAAGKSISGIDGASEDGKYILLPYEKVTADNVDQYQ